MRVALAFFQSLIYFSTSYILLHNALHSVDPPMNYRVSQKKSTINDNNNKDNNDNNDNDNNDNRN